MSWDTVCETACPIAQSLSFIGDRWTLLIMRELSMGNRRFDDIQAQTGMSPTLLSTRLKRLEEDGIIERRPYSERPLRYEYYPTEKGLALDPILAQLRAWGMKWGAFPPKQEPAARMFHKETQQELTADTPVTSTFRFSDYNAAMSPHWAEERNARREAFLQGRQLKSGEEAASRRKAKPTRGGQT